MRSTVRGALACALALAVVLVQVPGVAAYAKPVRHVHNIHNPHATQFRREVTEQTAGVADASFDFVIVGGGCAGLALASRLSEWSNVTVLVIEAGGNGSDVADQIDIPGYSYLHSLTGSAYDWAYNTVVQDDAGGVAKYWPRGKGLGGSGAINGLFWCRGAQSEYDSWATLNPNADQTWNWEEISKYISKAENFSQPNSTVQDYFGMVLNASAHGSEGPIQAGFSEYIFDSVKNWIPSWTGLGFTAHDLSDGNTRGVMITPSTLNMRNQTRSDSKSGYIDPLPPRSNLVILTGQQVTKVLFNGTTDSAGNILASGVQFQASNSATSYSVQANREIILAGGTIGSAQILQLSGIGPSSTLTALGIDVQVDLPVGYNLQDHISYTMYWSTPQGTLTWANLSYTNELGKEQLEIYEDSATGMWTYINEAVGYVSMSDITGSLDAAQTYQNNVLSEMNDTISDVTSWLDLPDNVATGLRAQYALQSDWLVTDVGQLEIIMTMLGQGDNTIGIQVALQHPWSRGTVLINSTSAFTAPLINPDYYGVGYDIDISNMGSEFARTLAAAAPLSNILLTETAPGANYTGDALGNYTKSKCGTEYHPIGTCSMLPKDSGGVVDTNLIVYGTNNLRVIDASIAPIHMSSHTMAVAYGIAEKGADIIKSRWEAAVTSNTTTEASGTASAGVATDTAVTGSNGQSGASTSNLSLGAKIGIGAGVGVGALAVLAGLLAFCLVRRKRKNADVAAVSRLKSYGQPGSAAPYKEATEGDYPLATLPAPAAPFSRDPHHRQPSVESMDTMELYATQPMRSESGYGISGYERSGTASPYRDDDSDGLHTPGTSTPRGSWVRPEQQHYLPVRPRTHLEHWELEFGFPDREQLEQQKSRARLCSLSVEFGKMGLLTIIRKNKAKSKEMRILFLGLDNAGKTTILKKLSGQSIEGVSPTLGFEIRTLIRDGYTLNIWDVGGQKTLRPYWRNYFESTDAVVWVVDSSDHLRLGDCGAELRGLLNEDRLAGATLLVFANKQDLAGSLTLAQIRDALGLAQLQSHKWHIQSCSAVTAQGLEQGIRWAVNEVAGRLYWSGLHAGSAVGEGPGGPATGHRVQPQPQTQGSALST